MAITDRSGLPIALHVDSARPYKVTLVRKTIEERFLVQLPERIIGDKAYDSDPLDAELAALGIVMIAPHRAGRKKPKTQVGRPLRRYRRRWKIERLFAWLQNFRRIGVRWEYHLHNFLGMIQLGCIIILLRFFEMGSSHPLWKARKHGKSWPFSTVQRAKTRLVGEDVGL